MDNNHIEQPQIENGIRAVYITPEVPLFCFQCHDAEAVEYRLVRRAGKYIALCFKGGQGCWEQNPPPLCEYKDHQGVQCGYHAEWTVSYGLDKLMRTNRCLLHVAPALSDVTVHEVFPL